MRKSPNSENSSNKIFSFSKDKSFTEVKARVRYSETDRMGVAHNKNYFEWFEIGRTEFCRQKNIPYKEIEKQGYYLVVVESFCQYKKPLGYDDPFLIRVSLEKISSKKVVFVYELVTEKEKKKIASGYTVHIVTNAQAKVCSLPAEILMKLKA